MNGLTNDIINCIKFEIGDGEDAEKVEITLADGEKPSDYLKRLFRLSKMHDVAHLAGDALDKNDVFQKFLNSAQNDNAEREIVLKAKTEFEKQVFSAIYRAEQQQFEYGEICRIFEEEKFEFIPLKGSVLRAFYKKPWMRTSCDIDILVKRDKIKDIIRVLTKKYGYTYAIRTQHDYSLYSAGGVHIELHFILIFHDESGDEFTKKVWNTATTAENCVYKKQMDGSLFYAYHLAHMAQHVLEGGGCGIKPFIDLYVMRKKMNLTEKNAEADLEKCGLTKFSQKVTELFNFWFYGEKPSENLSVFEEFIINGGVYGNLNNRASVGASKQQGKFKYVLKRIFVPYRSLCLLYPSLEKCPILFPFYQVARWFRLLKKDGVKVDGAVKELKSISNVSAEEKQKTAEMLKTLGL